MGAEEKQVTTKMATRSTRERRLTGFAAYTEKCLRDWQVPGAAVAVVDRTSLLYAQGFGRLRMDREEPVTAQTRFYIGSCTKAFTTTALGMLVEEGKLLWDAPVREVWPEFRLRDPVATERILVRDLLTHRTGLPRHDFMWVRSPATRAELCAQLRHLEFSTDLRTLYQYNNLMYMVAGHLIEVVSGITWERFIAARIFQPLGMTNSTICTALCEPEENLAAGHMKVQEGVRVWQQVAKCNPHTNIGPCGPGGAIVSTVLDMGRWLQLQLQQGKFGRRRLVKAATLQGIHSPHMVIPDAPIEKEFFEGAYGLGWVIQPYRGHRVIKHFGSLSGYNASAHFLPEEGYGIVCLTNIGHSPVAEVLPLTLIDRLLELSPIDWNARRKRSAKAEAAKAKQTKSKEKRARNSMPSHPLADYMGEYAHPGYGSVYVTFEKNRLHLSYNTLPFRLKHYHYDVFSLIDEGTGEESFRTQFHSDVKGKVVSLTIGFEPAVADIEFRRQVKLK